MGLVASARTLPIEWAVSARPLPGRAESGDRAVVAATAAGALLAVIDGLGHGEAAAAAADKAVAALRRHAGEPLAALVRRCHEALRPTRGAALTLAEIDVSTSTLSWLGVGDVDAVLWPAPSAGGGRRRRRIVGRGGVVGAHLPALQTSAVPIDSGDVIVLATDGLRADFARTRPELEPREASRDLLDRFARRVDDALVLVAIYRGPPR